MDAALIELARTLRSMGPFVALGAWGYCVYCCNAIERRRAANAGPMALTSWLFGNMPLGLARYRRRFFVSIVVFVWAVVLSRALSVLAGLDG
jgi:hypothetical protein